MTHGPLPKEPLPIRLVFKLERAEHPRLYDELIRFRREVIARPDFFAADVVASFRAGSGNLVCLGASIPNPFALPGCGDRKPQEDATAGAESSGDSSSTEPPTE